MSIFLYGIAILLLFIGLIVMFSLKTSTGSVIIAAGILFFVVGKAVEPVRQQKR